MRSIRWAPEVCWTGDVTLAANAVFRGVAHRMGPEGLATWHNPAPLEEKGEQEHLL